MYTNNVTANGLLHSRADRGGGARDDEDWMRVALVQADRGVAIREVPVGAVLIDPDGNEVVAAHNLRETDSDPTAHAEIVALRTAARARGSWRLEGHTLFVTLEPCVMCAGALVHARVARVVWGCDDPKAGGSTLFSIGQDPRLNHRYAITRGVLEAECSERLKRFFAGLRARASAKKQLMIAANDDANERSDTWVSRPKVDE